MITGSVKRGKFNAAFVASLGDAVAAAVNVAVGAAADEVVAEMQAEVPRKSGRLAGTIRKEALGKFGYKIRAGGADTKNSAGYDYALAVEFGNHHSPSNPFFYRSYRRKKARAKRLITNGIRDAVRKKASSA